MGSKPTCGDAAARVQRIRTISELPDDGSQPNHDIHAGCSEGAAASARAFPKVAVQQAVAALADAAVSARGSEAQIATFAKSAFFSDNTDCNCCDAA